MIAMNGLNLLFFYGEADPFVIHFAAWMLPLLPGKTPC